MKGLFQQAKIVQRTKVKAHIQEEPQGLREDVATVVSGGIRGLQRVVQLKLTKKSQKRSQRHIYSI